VNRKIFKNTLFLSGSQIIGRVIGFLYFIFLARSLSVASLGIYAWVLGFGYNFYPLADFGLERVVLKHIPRDSGKTSLYLSRLLPLRLLLAVGSILSSLILGLLIGVGRQKLFYIFIFGLGLLPYNLLYLYGAFKNAQERTEVYATITVLTSFLSSLLGVVIICLGLGLGWLFAVYFLANAAILALLLLKARKLDLSVSWKFEIDFWKRILKESWVFAVLTITAVFYLRIPLILVGRLLGDYWAGIYGSASKFVEAGILIPQSLTLALFPLSSRLLVSNRERLKRIYKRAITLLFLFSLPVALTMAVGGQYIIPFIYGHDYSPAIPVFSLFGLLMILFFVNSFPGNIIHNSDRVKSFIPFALLNFLVATVSGLILIPRVGVIGGVWAMIIGEIYGLVVNNLFVFRILNK